MHQISKVAAPANAIIMLMVLRFTVFGFSNEFNLAEIVECIAFTRHIRQDVIKREELLRWYEAFVERLDCRF